MKTDETYKKLYEQTKKQLDMVLKHRRHNVKTCKYCKQWYKEVLEETKKVKDKQLRDNLFEIWETLWLNGCLDFDIITSLFEVSS